MSLRGEAEAISEAYSEYIYKGTRFLVLLGMTVMVYSYVR